MVSVSYRWPARHRVSLALPVVLFLLLPAWPNPSSAQALTFNDALSAAVREAPILRAGDALIESAQHATIPAAALPDPKLVLGLDNVPVNGTDRYSLDNDFMTMKRVGLMQEFPSEAKRRAREEQAFAQVDVMRVERHLQRQTVLRETAQAWILRQTWERQQALVPQLENENRLLGKVVKAQLAAANGTALDVLLPQEEAADIAALQDQIVAGRKRAIAQLRRWIGANAEQPLSGEAPHWTTDLATLSHQLHQHPELQTFDSKARLLDAEIAQSRAAKQPDWDVTVAWLGRGSGYSDMAMLEVRVDLPVFPGSRQNPVIAGKIAERTALDAERDASLREHTAMLEEDFAEYQRLEQADQRFSTVLMPLAEEKVALALASWRSGEGSLVDVIGARRERIALRMQAIATMGALAQSAAQLHFAFSDTEADTTEVAAGTLR